MRKDKKIVQKLKSPQLQKIRYELRTLLHLEFQKRFRLLTREWKMLYEDESLTYELWSEMHKKVNMKRGQLQLMERKYPISCGICGDRMENLVWNPIQHQWLCVPCYNHAHENFPKVYP